MKWNEVTWYSRLLALFVFLSLPFLGFYLGMQYQSTISEQYAVTDFYIPKKDSATSLASQSIYHDPIYKFFITIPKLYFDINTGNDIYAYHKDFSTNKNNDWTSKDIGFAISISKDETAFGYQGRLKNINDLTKSSDTKILESKTVSVGGVPGTQLLINYDPTLGFYTTGCVLDTLFKLNGVTHEIEMESDTCAVTTAHQKEYEALVQSFHY